MILCTVFHHITKSHNGRNKYSIWKQNIATEAREKDKDESLFLHFKPITLSSIDIQGNIKKATCFKSYL